MSDALKFDEEGRRLVAGRMKAFARQEAADAPALKRAAVALTLLATQDGSGEAALLLTRRAARLRAHSFQWALPGGRSDGAETPIETALRELREEAGLDLGAHEVLGVLDDYDTHSGYRMTPIVVWADATDALLANADEVESLHRIPLRTFAASGAAQFVDRPGEEKPLLRYPLHDSFLHAPTAAIIYQFCEAIGGRVVRVADFDVPDFARR